MTASDHTLKPFRNFLHQRGHPYMHKLCLEDALPLTPHRHLAYGLCYRYAKSCVAVQNGNADLDFRD